MLSTFLHYLLRVQLRIPERSFWIALLVKRMLGLKLEAQVKAPATESEPRPLLEGWLGVFGAFLIIE